MKSVLDQNVLVLNRNWQAVNTRTVQDAIAQVFAGAATLLDIRGKDDIRPVTWEEWIQLPVPEGEDAIHTSKLAIKVPTVIVAVNYSKVPKKRPKLGLRGVAQRDGNRCQYSGKVLSREEMSVDHVLPRSRGGKDEWTNLVLADKELNQKKGSKTNGEAGLKLLRAPVAPAIVPVSATLRPSHPHHHIFLK